ncbi:MAG: EAL domain-containing protein [Cyanobacteria bacterium P01_F01_bin.116]
MDFGAEVNQIALGVAVGSLVVSLIAVVLQNRRLNQEVHRRQQVEASLRDSEAHYRALIMALPDLIMRLNRDGIYLEFLASPNFSLLAKEPAAWVGTHVADKMPPESAKKRLLAIQKALDSQLMQVYEQDLSIDGVLQIEQVRVIPYSDNEVLILVQDISDRKQAEEKLRISEQRFRRAIEMAPLPIMIHAEDGEVLYINGTWTELTGYVQADIPTTQHWATLAYCDDAERVFANVIKQKYTLEPSLEEGVFTVRSCTGRHLSWQFRSAPLERLLDGRQVIISMAVDITQSRQAELALRDSEERYRSIYNQAAVGLANCMLDGKFIDINPRFCEMLGYSREELLVKSVVEITYPEDRAETQDLFSNLLVKGTNHFFCEKRYLCKDGSYFWANTGVSIVRDSWGNPKQTLAVIRDISDRIKAEEQLKHDALHDQLTGLPSRSLLMERLELALKRTKRHPETQLAVLFLDLDNFKIINDSLGHLMGDNLLLAISTRLQLVVRETDLAARLGGDEFVVLLEDITGLTEATMVAERILETLQSPVILAEQELFPSVSIGIVTSNHQDCYEAADLLRDADAAMYSAKQSGRGQYKVFDASMHLRAIQRLHIENSLRRALKKEEFVLYYQPIINLTTQQIETFEALIRWQHPEEGLLTPERFITIAEKIGLSLPIGEWVLRQACQQLITWQTDFPERSLKVSVNLSVQQLDANLLPKLEKILKEYAPPRNSLTLEITEGMLVQNVDLTRDLLVKFQNKGVNIVIDDFGTGYSCLRHLHRLPVSALKIDREFISPAESELQNRVIAESIISLCKSLGLKAIAEGVETSEQVDWLRQIGCDAGQGFYFAKPMKGSDISQLWE